MANVENTQIVFSAKDETKAAVASLKSGFDAITSGGDKIGAAFGSLKGALGALGVTIAAKEMVDFAKSTIDAADALNDMSKRTGIGVEQLAGWKLAAEQSGTSMEAVAKGLQKMSSYMATNGEKLAAIGVTSKTAEGALMQLADVLNSMPVDSPERMALAVKILGKNAAELLPLLSEGSTKLRDMVKAGGEYSGQIAKLAKDSDAFNDELAIMTTRFAAGAGVLIDKMLPALTRFMQLINDTTPPSEVAGDLFDQLLQENEKLNRFLESKKRGFYVDDDDIADQRAKIAQISKELRDAVAANDRELAKNAKAYDLANQPPPKDSAVNNIIGDDGAAAKRSAELAKQLAATQQFYAEVNTLGESVAKLNNKDETQIEILQKKLDAMARLDPVIKTYIQGQLDLARATEDMNRALDVQNAFYEAQAIGDQNAAEILDAEKKLEDDRIQAYADMAEALKVENEDLNVGLIESDKKRAQAQLELEHARSIERINNLGLESDQAQELIDAETKNFEIRVKQLDKQKSLGKDLGLTFSSAFEDAITGGKKFSDVLKSLALDIEKLLIRRTITEPFMNSIDGLLGGSSGGDFFGKIGDWIGGLFGGGKAVGGPVNSSQFYMVGERGPELFVPNTAGTIIPNNALGGGGGVVVNLIEAPGNGGQVNQSKGDDGVMTIDIMVEQIEAKMKRNMTRGDGLAPTIEGLYGLNRAAGAVR